MSEAVNDQNLPFEANANGSMKEDKGVNGGSLEESSKKRANANIVDDVMSRKRAKTPDNEDIEQKNIPSNDVSINAVNTNGVVPHLSIAAPELKSTEKGETPHSQPQPQPEVAPQVQPQTVSSTKTKTHEMESLMVENDEKKAKDEDEVDVSNSEVAQLAQGDNEATPDNDINAAQEEGSSKVKRWRVHQMAEDYVNLVGDMMYTGTHLGSFGYDAGRREYPIEGVSALGYLKSSLRRPSVIERWSPYEISLFEASLLQHGKDFMQASQAIGTKSTKETIEFYYIWKKTSHYKKWKEQYVSDTDMLDFDSLATKGPRSSR